VASTVRYADAFGTDRGRFGCWRYVYEATTDGGGGSGRPVRCADEVQWAGWHVTQHQRWRVWSCDAYLDGGERWAERPGRRKTDPAV